MEAHTGTGTDRPPRRSVIAFRPRNNDEHRRNEHIRARQVRLIDAEGDQVGVVPLPRALDTAADARLDLVEVAPNADPPVCRIMDYGKYRYEQSVKEREAKKRQQQTQVKEMKYRPKIGDADFATKTRKVAEFLEDGNKVKITVRLRGRERSRPELAREMVERVVEDLGGAAKIEHPPRGEGAQVSAVVGPAT